MVEKYMCNVRSILSAFAFSLPLTPSPCAAAAFQRVEDVSARERVYVCINVAKKVINSRARQKKATELCSEVQPLYGGNRWRIYGHTFGV